MFNNYTFTYKEINLNFQITYDTILKINHNKLQNILNRVLGFSNILVQKKINNYIHLFQLHQHLNPILNKNRMNVIKQYNEFKKLINVITMYSNYKSFL